MPKPTKTELKKYKATLEHHLSVLRGDVGSMRDEALRPSQEDSPVDHSADQGSDAYDTGFLLGLIENEVETIQRIEEALARLEGAGEYPFGVCPRCQELASASKGRKKPVVWIARQRLAYIPWAQFCVDHQSEQEQDREIA